MNEPKLLKAPDKERYILYRKTPNREMKFSANYKANVPQGMSQADEKELAEALMRNNYLYFEEQVRKFWDDFNSLMA